MPPISAAAVPSANTFSIDGRGREFFPYPTQGRSDPTFRRAPPVTAKRGGGNRFFAYSIKDRAGNNARRTWTNSRHLGPRMVANAPRTRFLSSPGELPLTRQVELMRGLSTVHFSSGQVVYREGDPSDALYFMLGPSAEDLEAGAPDDEHGELTSETHEKGLGAGRACPFVPSKRYFGEEGLVYR